MYVVPNAFVTFTSNATDSPALRRMLRPSASGPVSGSMAPGFDEMRT